MPALVAQDFTFPNGPGFGGKPVSTITDYTAAMSQHKAGDKIEVREPSRKINNIVASLATVEKRPMLSWLELDKANFAGTFKGAPVREELNEPVIKEQLIVEYYSR